MQDGPHFISALHRETQQSAPLPARSAERHADFFLPYLRSGMRLLDVGCGAASITSGLARRVAPALSIGLDSSLRRLQQAREHGVQGDPGDPDAGRVRLVAGDACSLPFANGGFDAAFSHALLQHLPAPLNAVRELHRVLRPGGVVGVADWDLETSILHPTSPLLARSLALFGQQRLRSGGCPDVGRRLAGLLDAAGFQRAEMTVRADGLASSRSSRSVGEQWATHFEREATIAQLTASGLAEREELRQMSQAWRVWGATPGAICVTHWFCAAAFR